MPQNAASDEAKRKLLDSLRTSVPAENTIFTEGETSSEMYILLSGVLDIRKGGQVMATISDKNTYVGEMSALLGEPRSATVSAVEDSVLIRVPEDRVTDFFNHSPDLALKLSKILAGRLGEMNLRHQKLIENVGTADYQSVSMYERLTASPARKRFMTVYSRRRSDSLPLAKLSAALKTCPAETMRIFADFEAAKLIRTEGDTVTFLDPPDPGLSRAIDIFAASLPAPGTKAT